MGYAKSETTQRKLLEATSSLLRTRGFAATGIKEIVATSGVPRGSVYHHFPGGKEELAASAVSFSGASILARLEVLVTRTGHPVAALRAFCDYYIEQLEGSGFRKGCPLATVSLEAAPEIDAVYEASSAAFGSIIQLFADALITQGVESGRAQDLGVTVVSCVEGAILLAKALRSRRPLDVVREQLTGQLESELRGQQ